MPVAIGLSGDRVGALAGSGWRTTRGIPGARRRRVRTPVTQHPQDAWSVEQVKEITATAIRNPQAEKELLKAAQSQSLKGLKDECRRVKARRRPLRGRGQRVGQLRGLCRPAVHSGDVLETDSGRLEQPEVDGGPVHRRRCCAADSRDLPGDRWTAGHTVWLERRPEMSGGVVDLYVPAVTRRQ